MKEPTRDDLVAMLKLLVRMYRSVREGEPLPPCLHVTETWDKAAELVRQAERIPDIFEPVAPDQPGLLGAAREALALLVKLRKDDGCIFTATEERLREAIARGV